MLTFVPMSKHWDFFKIIINRSRFFGTIKRSKILNVLHRAGWNEDEIWLVRLLLADIKGRVHLKTVYSAWFRTIGTQRDSLPPTLSTNVSSAVQRYAKLTNLPNLITWHATRSGICRWYRLHRWGSKRFFSHSFKNIERHIHSYISVNIHKLDENKIFLKGDKD